MKTITSSKDNQLTCDAILFDLDGVLIDSTACIRRHWQAWAERHGLDIDEIMRHAHGIRTVETMRMVAPHLDLEKEAEAFAAHEVQDARGVLVISGAAELLAALPESSWGIVTSGGLELVRTRLAKTGLPFPKVLVTSEDVTRGKPDPEPYQVGVKRLGLATDRCLVIEDAPAGVEAGKRAGLRVIGIAATHGREALLQKGADCVVDRLADLKLRDGTDGGRLVLQWE